MDYPFNVMAWHNDICNEKSWKILNRENGKLLYTVMEGNNHFAHRHVYSCYNIIRF